MDAELLKIMERHYNFTSHLIDERHNWGILLPNGTWTGSVGRVIKKVT